MRAPGAGGGGEGKGGAGGTGGRSGEFLGGGLGAPLTAPGAACAGIRSVSWTQPS